MSNINIPELPQSNHDKVGLLFGLKKTRQQSTDLSWPNYWQDPSGKVVLAYCKKDSYHWLRFPELADFRISADTREISCYPLPEIPQETIRHLFLDQVLPRCLAHQGRLIIHASGVLLEQGILIFIGNSGAGKSTLAGYFHQSGQRVISDDVLWIKAKQDQQVRAVPSYTGLRLQEDSLQVLFPSEQNIYLMAHYSEKKRVQLNVNTMPRFSKGIPVLAVIVLSQPNQTSHREVCLEPLFRRDAFIKILNETFQLDSFDLKERLRRIQSLGRMVTRLSSFQLSMPHDYDLLPTVRQKILEKVL